MTIQVFSWILTCLGLAWSSLVAWDPCWVIYSASPVLSRINNIDLIRVGFFLINSECWILVKFNVVLILGEWKREWGEGGHSVPFISICNRVCTLHTRDYFLLGINLSFIPFILILTLSTSVLYLCKPSVRQITLCC